MRNAGARAVPLVGLAGLQRCGSPAEETTPGVAIGHFEIEYAASLTLPR